MITYDWPKVFTFSKGDSSVILGVMGYLYYMPMVKNNYDFNTKKLSSMNWEGTSYLVNPKPLLAARQTIDDVTLAEYVALASFRNLAEYYATKRTTLRVEECPVPVESLKENKLLTVANGHIHFCWEETLH